MDQVTKIERAIESLIGTPKNYFDHRSELYLELQARYVAAIKISALPITEKTFDRYLPQLLELTKDISSNLYHLIEIKLRSPICNMLNNKEPPDELDLYEFKRISTAATIVFCSELLRLLEESKERKPDLSQAERADFIAHLILETERVYRNMLLAIDSQWELEIVANQDRHKEQDRQSGFYR